MTGGFLRRGRAAALCSLGGGVLLALAAGRLRVEPGVHGPRWFGLLGIARTDAALDVASGATLGGFLLLGIATSLMLWHRPSVPSAGVVGVLGALPLLVAPPVGSLDVYAYVGQGRMAARGIDPYRHGLEALGGVVAAAADPRWRTQPSPYGPLALLVSRGASDASGGSLAVAVVLLRVVAVVSVLVAVLLAARLAADPLLAVAIGGSPLVLVTLVSAAHHEALVAALVLGALTLHRAARPGWAAAAGAAAAAVKLPGVVVLGAMVCLDVAEAHQLGRKMFVVARAALATVVVWGLLALVVPDELGWVQALSTPGAGRSPQAPVVLAYRALPGSLGHWRAAGEALAVALVALLLMTVRRRPLPATVGWGLLLVGLLGPVLYPWYLAPAALVLATLPGWWPRLLASAAGFFGPWLAIPRIG